MHTHKPGVVARTTLGLLAAGLVLAACGKNMNVNGAAALDSGEVYATAALYGWSSRYARAAADGRRPDSDIALLIKVKSALVAAPALQPFALDAGVLDGVVTLYGEVDTFERRAMAERIARDVRGVQEVKSSIVVIQSA